MNRNKTLDVLRAIAVLAVIVHHYATSEHSFLHLGGAGVDLFFVLSGFLISSLLFAEIKSTGEVRLGRFLLRRGLKIYPAFYVFLILTFPLVPSSMRWRIFGEMFFLQQYVPHVWQHTWTLSVEETFYVAIPILIAVLHRAGVLRWFPAVPIAVIAGLTVLRILGFAPVRFEGLALGSLIGYIHNFHDRELKRCVGWWSWPAAAVFLVPLLVLRGELVFTSSCVAFGFAVSWSAVHGGLRVRALNTIGQYSYSIYLWHMVVAMIAWSVMPHNVVGLVLDLVLTLAIGIAMSILVEIPVLKIRDRIFPRQAVVLMPSSAALTPEIVHATPVLGSVSNIPC